MFIVFSNTIKLEGYFSVQRTKGTYDGFPSAIDHSRETILMQVFLALLYDSA